ncbi:MAG: hypothetical protein E7388_06170 [Ruminococcaceae bacterium]|nr:hypothetical protein [Oscillospiraceae bacterium]
MKKIITFLLGFVMIFSLCTGISFATEQNFVEANTAAVSLDNGLEYVKYTKYCKITGYTGTATEISIPEEIEGVPVTVIDDYAFCDLWAISTLADDDSVSGDVGVEDSIFDCCANLISMEIPSTITIIGEGAFSGCTSLETVYYYGTEAQWDAITLGSENENLTSAEIIFVPAPDLDKVIKEKTTVEDFAATLGQNYICEVYKNGVLLSSDSYMGTGMTVVATNKIVSKEYTSEVVVLGDVNGDGLVKAGDYMKVKKAIADSTLLTGAYFKAADVTGDGLLKAADYMRLKRYLSGELNIYA